MSRIKGKKLTVNQRSILNNNGIKDTKDWLYIKTIQRDGSSNLKRDSIKMTYLVIQNQQSGEIKEIEY